MILFLTFYGKRKGQGNLYRIASLAQKLKRFKQVVLYCNEKKQIKKSIKLSFDRIYDYKNITIKKILSNSNITGIVTDGYRITIKLNKYFLKKNIQTFQLNYDKNSYSNIKINHLFKNNKKKIFIIFV